MKDPIMEAFKEINRWGVLTMLSGLSAMLPFFPTQALPESIQPFVAFYLIPMILRWIDKYLHEKNKAKSGNVDGRSQGLLPF